MSLNRVFVVGDLNVDYFISGECFESGTMKRASIPVAGGNGFNAACAFAEEGFQTILIGSVGDDENGRFLQSAIADKGIEAIINTDTEKPTGTCHIVYPRDERYETKLKILNHDHANQYDPVFIEKILLARNAGFNDILFTTTDILARQGYVVSRDVAKRIGRFKPRIVLDVVPHDIYRKIGVRDLADSFVKVTDVLIAELETLTKLIGIEKEHITPCASDWHMLFRTFNVDIIALRYGFGNIAKETVSRKVEKGIFIIQSEMDTLYDRLTSPLEKRAYGDRLTAKLVKRIQTDIWQART